MYIIYVSIGNTDNKLTQQQWSEYISEVSTTVRLAGQIHGEWFSAPQSPFQNACWCVEVHDLVARENLRLGLKAIRVDYGQDSIAWADAPTVFL